MIVSRIDGATQEDIVTTCGKRFNMQDENIKFIFPKLGYVNTAHQCTYVTRISRRMWKVGLTNENIHSQHMYPAYAGMNDMMNNKDILEAILNVKKPKFKESLRRVATGHRAASAFSDKFCVGLHPNTTAPCIYYKNKYVGYWDKEMDALVISDTNSHMIQQLKEAINDDEVKIIV